MTYCVGMILDRGLVFMTDTRTNAGVDNISIFRKLFTWEQPGERFLVMATAGNLATTQAVVSMLDERNRTPAERNPSILEAPSMFQVARIAGRTLREVVRDSAGGSEAADPTFSATLMLGGQIAGMPPRLFMIYPEGNFVEASADTPFFQLGETKYGRPIILRTFDPAMSFEDAAKLLLVSFDSTIKANLSVGLPLDLQIYETDALKAGRALRIDQSDGYYQTISTGWGAALRQAFQSLPDFSFPAD
ncbi:MAG: proteasome-type protease [Geminicoccaceae bacterium]|nr:proteasome-type protease [Geminicoccaceae bacterium]